MRSLLRHFAQGILYVTPLAVTVYLLQWMFTFLDSIVGDLIQLLFGRYIPGLGLLIIVVFLLLVGYLGGTIIAKPLKAAFDRLIGRIPILNTVYSAFNDLVGAVVGQDRKFKHPVRVKIYPDSDVEKLGFLTQDDLSPMNAPDLVAVYFPHSYNFSGELFLVPRERVRPVHLAPADVMKFVVSGGVSELDP